MSKCRHPKDSRSYVSRRVGMQYRVCTRCGEWLSLGKANDTPAAQLELRAATLAEYIAGRRGQHMSVLSIAEYYGWLDRVGPMTKRLLFGNEESGWLAHAIVHHGEEQGDG